MKKFGLMLITGLLLNGLALAQVLPEVKPSEIGFTPGGVKSLDSLMERYTQPDRFPCAMLMVARIGKIGYWKAFGVRDLETCLPYKMVPIFDDARKVVHRAFKDAKR